MNKIIIESYIMCRDERTEIPQLICYIIGYWVKIGNVSVSLSIDEMRTLINLNADIEESPDFKENISIVNENPHFVFNKDNVLIYKGLFEIVRFRYSIIETIKRYFNKQSFEIQDDNTWMSTETFDKEHPKILEQTKTYYECVMYYRDRYIRQFLNATLSEDNVHQVITGDKKCVIDFSTDINRLTAYAE